MFASRPRSPLAIFEVREEPFAVKRETMTIIDNIDPGDGPQTQMSNFRFYQDRPSGDVILFLARYGSKDPDNWKMADYYRYRIRL